MKPGESVAKSLQRLGELITWWHFVLFIVLNIFLHHDLYNFKN
jgi:hypothetical protein